ncbi:DNA-binding response regulator [Sphingobium amiense]|uniref:DNA-binding response regulator n=1 Tax=Sphingobium amiense TaxID=135719 RepID=A0A494W1I7_9SPHN|nr:response regulator transcription factor [Sphingobium amiense]BBD97058.1 DNA-binding response regulator [Sphingobium amiense]
MTFHILVAEDDRLLQGQLVRQLSDFGHEVETADDGGAALELLGRRAFDVVILDWKMPVMDGITVVRKLRDAGVTVPVLMLTAMGRVYDKVEGLEAGADDYVVKPVDPLELNARINALVRARRMSASPADTVSAGDIVVSPSRMQAWRGGDPLNLSQMEFRLLLELARNAGSVVTRPMLIEKIWGLSVVPAANVIEAHIRNLRVKLMERGDDPISTRRGIGYTLRA